MHTHAHTHAYTVHAHTQHTKQCTHMQMVLSHKYRHKHTENSATKRLQSWDTNCSIVQGHKKASYAHKVPKCWPNAVPPGALVFDLWFSVLCMRSKAWLAARVSLRLARLPRTASSAQRSRRLRSTRAAAPVLLAHADVTKNILFLQWVQNLGTRR